MPIRRCTRVWLNFIQTFSAEFPFFVLESPEYLKMTREAVPNRKNLFIIVNMRTIAFISMITCLKLSNKCDLSTTRRVYTFLVQKFFSAWQIILFQLKRMLHFSGSKIFFQPNYFWIKFSRRGCATVWLKIHVT